MTDLYETDFYGWIQNQVNLLKTKQWQQLDHLNLIEEIEALGRKERQELRNRLGILLGHLLKWQFQPDKRTNSWLFTIREHRKRLRNDFKNSPSLKRYFLEVFPECYQDARELAADETGLSINTFPIESPFSQEDTLNPDYLPE